MRRGVSRDIFGARMPFQPEQHWKTLPAEAPGLLEAIAEAGGRVLLFGAPGVGKSTLVERLAGHLLAAGRPCHCIGADPGRPLFGPPGAVSLARPSRPGWTLLRSEPLCTLDAGRFRLPLVVAVSRLAPPPREDGILLLDGPGVCRGIAGRELLAGLVEAAAIDLVLVVAHEGRPVPLAQTLRALGKKILLVPADRRARRPGARARARVRTERWNTHLEGAHCRRFRVSELALTGTPPPLDEAGAWIGRQVALLKSGTSVAMGEVSGLEGGILTLQLPGDPGGADILLVRDAARGADGMLRTAPPFAPEPVVCLPRAASPAVENGGPPVSGRAGIVDFELVNGVFGDPLLHLRLRHCGRSLLFDLGEGNRLPARVAHRVTDVFISHAHMDHLGGFQWLLRARLGRFPLCRIFGPPGIGGRIASFIGSFLWDRVGDEGPAFEVAEFHGDRVERMRLQAGRAESVRLEPRSTAEGILLEEPGFRVRAVLLDHHTPVLAFAFEPAGTLNIRKDRLAASKLAPGPWLNELKRALLAGERQAAIPLPDGRRARAEELERTLVLRSPGKKVVYATDLADTPGNRQKLVALARNAHTFFCEAPFSEAEREQAFRTGHLTARAAGEIACQAGVARLIPFHFSRRHRAAPRELLAELEEACDRVVLPGSGDGGPRP